MNQEFKFTMGEFPDKEFCITAPSLISAMMQALSSHGVNLPDNELRDWALQMIEEVNYKWLNKP